MPMLQKEISRLKEMVLSVGAKVEQDLRLSVKAVDLKDESLASSVIESDAEVDKMEVELEEECLKVLALHQPVATDLRFIIAILKMNNDLERIGDLAVNIAERAIDVSRIKNLNVPNIILNMADDVNEMVKLALDALVNMNEDLANKVRMSDDKVDDANREMFKYVKNGIRENVDNLDGMILLLSISRYLERIADHATNIAEDVMYMLKGEIVRHPNA